MNEPYTTCLHNHQITPDNLIGRRRRCRECNRQKCQRWYAKHTQLRTFGRLMCLAVLQQQAGQRVRRRTHRALVAQEAALRRIAWAMGEQG